MFVDLETRTGLAIEKLHSKFENLDAAVRENATVRVVLLAPRERVQFIISFLLHNKPTPIGSKVIFT